MPNPISHHHATRHSGPLRILDLSSQGSPAAAEISQISSVIYSRDPSVDSDDVASEDGAPAPAGALPLSPAPALPALPDTQAQRTTEPEHAAAPAAVTAGYDASSRFGSYHPPTASPASTPTPPPADAAVLLLELRLSESRERLAETQLEVERLKAAARAPPVGVPPLHVPADDRTIRTAYTNGTSKVFDPAASKGTATVTNELTVWLRGIFSLHGFPHSSNSSTQDATLLVRYGLAGSVLTRLQNAGLFTQATSTTDVAELIAALRELYPNHLFQVSAAAGYFNVFSQFGLAFNNKSNSKPTPAAAIEREQVAYHTLATATADDVHAARRTATLLAAQLGYNADAIEACLIGNFGVAAVVPDSVRKTVVLAGLSEEIRTATLARAGASSISFADFLVELHTYLQESKTTKEVAGP
jgi:hypothetical protein